MANSEIFDPPGNETAGWDNVRVTFEDGSSTLVLVNQDDSISEAVAELCDQPGWNTKDVTNTTIEK